METRIIESRFLKLAAAALLAIALSFMALAQPAFADESSSAASASAASDAAASSDQASASAGSASAESPSATAEEARGGLPLMGDDYVWFGRDLELYNTAIGNDLIGAGQTINVKDTIVGGSFRVAGQTVTIRDSMTAENITAAAETAIVKDTTAKAVAIAGKSASFSGACDTLTIYAETIIIDGVVDGDVVAGGNYVEIGPNAHITGTLHVSAPKEPTTKQGAEIGKLDFTKSESSATSPAQVQTALAELASVLFIVVVVLAILGTLVIAVLAEWLFRRHTAGAANMIRERTGAYIGTGIVSAIVAPIAVILLLALGITIPVAGALALALFAMTIVAGGFMGASVFKLAFPRLNRFVCALIGGVIIGVASAIPFLGSLVGAAAFMYLLGYVIQSIFLGIRNPEPAYPSPAPTPFGPVTAPAPVANAAAAPTAPVPAAPAAAVPAEPAEPESESPAAPTE